MKWLEVSLIVDGELAEAVADVLSRHVPNGVALQIEDAGDRVNASTRVKVLAYLNVDDGTEARREKIEQGLWHLGQIQPIPKPSYRVIEEQNWNKIWKASYKPIPIGESLLVLPAWYEAPKGKRQAIILDPGMAFGTGLHPTTQLCLTAMEDYLETGASVIDLGCGSGILSIAAIRLGAGTVWALDTDPTAIENARTNIKRNGMPERIRLEEGSLPKILNNESGQDSADLLLANIYSTILVDLLDAGLTRAVRPQGRLILSGIMRHQSEAIRAKCMALGAQLLETRRDGDWVALVLRKLPELP
ncbi:MAG: 50S ribosomal protein L11 methyltransferase [Anaerolineales bacterium]